MESGYGQVLEESVLKENPAHPSAAQLARTQLIIINAFLLERSKNSSKRNKLMLAAFADLDMEKVEKDLETYRLNLSRNKPAKVEDAKQVKQTLSGYWESTASALGTVAKAVSVIKFMCWMASVVLY